MIMTCMIMIIMINDNNFLLYDDNYNDDNVNRKENIYQRYY